jgi:preprotein translocase SecE subunit
VARNRKRAKERRARRPQTVASRRADRDEAPDPIAHAAPDVELAEAQLAIGRPDLDASPVPGVSGYEPAFEDEEELEPEPEPIGAGGGRAGVRIGAGFDGDEGDGGGGPGAAAAAAPAGAVQPRIGLLARLIGFLQGSWRELQRVQWPDRRQVAQATAVVIGFVIVAGVFLGLADLAFSHLVNYVLYGK